MKLCHRQLEGKLVDLETRVVQVGRAAVSQQRMVPARSAPAADLPGRGRTTHRMDTLVSKKKLAKLTK